MSLIKNYQNLILKTRNSTSLYNISNCHLSEKLGLRFVFVHMTPELQSYLLGLVSLGSNEGRAHITRKTALKHTSTSLGQ